MFDEAGRACWRQDGESEAEALDWQEQPSAQPDCVANGCCVCRCDRKALWESRATAGGAQRNERVERLALSPVQVVC